MESVAEFVGRGEVAVLGLGASGTAAARLLRHLGLAVYGSDEGSDVGVQARAAVLRALGAAADTGGHDLERVGRAVLVIVSPGVPPDAAPVASARAAEIPIWAEAELGLRVLAGRVPYVAVTGTNGKTTTTAMVAHLLASGKRRAQAVGNIGTPVCDLAMSLQLPDVLAIELSSFQLHDMPSVDPTVGVVTNLAPDHLDRYPSIVDYYGDKMRLFDRARPSSLWVTNADDPVSEEWIQVRGRHRRFSVIGAADGWFDRNAAVLRLGDVDLLERSAFPLLGNHNVANALAAALAVHALGLATDVIAKGLRTVVALKHRLEPVGTIGGVLWINDSKATNLSSTEVAVAAMDRPYVLLLGGRHKGESYRRLTAHLGRCRAVVAFGEARPLIVGDLAGDVRVESAGTLDEAMARAVEIAKTGDAVLLSPACSSYDQFTNYQQRGARFRAVAEGR